MRYKTLSEVRMGAKDLAQVSDDYTIGFEFEIAMDEDIIRELPEFEERMKEEKEQFFEDFYERSNLDNIEIIDWLDDSVINDRYELSDFINKMNLTPKYGFVDTEDLEDEDREKLDGLSNLFVYNEDGDYVNVYLEIRKVSDIFDYFNDSDNEEIEDSQSFEDLVTDNEEILDSYSEWRTEQESDHINTLWKDKEDEIENDLVDTMIKEYDAKDLLNKVMDSEYPDHLRYINDVVQDTSVQPFGAEVVTNVINALDEGFEVMEDIFDVIKNNKYLSTNDSTGFHVNVGTWSREERKNIDILKFLLLVSGERILKDFDRSNNEFAIDNIKSIMDSLGKDRIGKDYNKFIEKLNDIIPHSKYTAFNTMKLIQNGYLEIRAFGGSGYEKRGDDIIRMTKTVLRAIEIASDPNAYKDDYYKKLYKYFGEDTQEKPSGITDIDKFIEDNFNASLKTKELSFLANLQTIVNKINNIKSVRPDNYKKFKTILPTFLRKLLERYDNHKINLDSNKIKQYSSILLNIDNTLEQINEPSLTKTINRVVKGIRNEIQRIS